jgi:hypothetical protein
MGICSFCLGDENKNAKGIPEDMINCAECGNCGIQSFSRSIKIKSYSFF